jgi:ABC-2 type transport system ATP-binding protein
VLDEPFSGLDPIAIGAMGDMLAELAEAGTTVLFSSHQLELVEDLCDDVVIIAHGSVVTTGELADLRAAVPSRFVDLQYTGDVPDWSTLPSAEVIDTAVGRARLRLDRDADLAAVVALIGPATEVISFAYQPPTLADLFRQAVAS